jgi:hypothetical protein
VKVLRKNIYLGIDGVILTKGVMPAAHLDKFLRYILNNYSVFWLTPKYRGSSKDIINYLSQFLSEEAAALLNQIRPTTFHLDKTEAINFNERFFLLVNDLFDSEKNTLKKYNAYDSWIKLDLIENPNQLLHLISSKHSLKK